MDSFTTRRLAAERLCHDHLADLVTLHLDPEVSRYLGGIRAPDVTQAYVAANIAHWDRYGFGLWVLKTRTGAFAGRAGLRHITIDGADEIEVAYTLKRSLWGQGLASEIALALVDIGLSKLRLPSLVGVASVGNLASRRVLEKSGFVFEGSEIYQGEEVVVYRVTQPI
ncbi:MAG: GNAT family N-acetyltransferase [Alphaproteobacteria bacterium]|nr:GNAT family N-acetyltransferase [Alphaproteobacteria bacterium]